MPKSVFLKIFLLPKCRSNFCQFLVQKWVLHLSGRSGPKNAQRNPFFLHASVLVVSVLGAHYLTLGMKRVCFGKCQNSHGIATSMFGGPQAGPWPFLNMPPNTFFVVHASPLRIVRAGEFWGKTRMLPCAREGSGKLAKPCVAKWIQKFVF